MYSRLLPQYWLGLIVLTHAAFLGNHTASQLKVKRFVTMIGLGLICTGTGKKQMIGAEARSFWVDLDTNALLNLCQRWNKTMRLHLWS